MISSSDIYHANVLIVDDQAANVSLLERMLRGAGYVTIASTMNSQEVYELHRKNRYDLIVLDIQMPYFDGFQVMEGLQELETDGYLPVLVITAHPEHKLRALQAGAKDFIGTPLDLPEVLMRVYNILEVRLLYKELHHYNDLLEERVLERTQELREVQLEVVHRLTHVTELRDNETGLHIVRIGLFCAQMGEAMGMSKWQCELLLNASPMHDIGKIGIPDIILMKSAPLTPQEWEIMKTHTTIGAELLSEGRSELTRMGHLIALNHHERWNGSGYPRGIVGGDIPLVARICSVCDAFDALTSDRPYKRAWSVEKAAATIREQTEQHFDPKLVELFINILPHLVEIKRQYAEPERKTADRETDDKIPSAVGA